MTSYNSQTGRGKYHIQFETDNKEFYESVQKVVQECVYTEELRREKMACPACGRVGTLRAFSVSEPKAGVKRFCVHCEYIKGGCESYSWVDLKKEDTNEK